LDPEIIEDSKELKDEIMILVVEDNTDLRKYIARIFDSSFQIMEADNGQTGLEKARNTLPDLIISDLMMPGLDGISFVSELKTDERTSHIPVILLTARADMKSKIEGLETGADDYLTKPFDKKELEIRVHNLLSQRSKLRERYRREFITGCEGIELMPEDERFLNRLANTIQQHLQDTAFNVENLSAEIGLSRSQLYRKTIFLTGFTPTEYLRNMRLKHAARLFQDGHINVTQVAYQVGFTNPSYFARCFRDIYGSVPSVYIKQTEG
jgi:DNA-binding response OmpR family regulator